METLHGLVDAQAKLIRDLTDRVCCLERRRRGHSSGGRSNCPPLSSDSSGYGSNPIPIPVPPPMRVEGFVGDGSHEHPYTHVVLDSIEDLDNLNL